MSAVFELDCWLELVEVEPESFESDVEVESVVAEVFDSDCGCLELALSHVSPVAELSRLELSTLFQDKTDCRLITNFLPSSGEIQFRAFKLEELSVSE